MNSPSVVLHIIPGTWHKVPDWLQFRKRTQGEKWYEPSSPFAKALRSQLEPESVLIKHFPWSGANSQLARERAARSLQTHLRLSLIDFPEAQHYIIGHSHGGTVAALAIQNSGSNGLEKIRGIITMATPYFYFSNFRGSWLEEVVRIYPLVAAPLAILGATIFLLTGSPENDIKQALLGAFLGLALAPGMLGILTRKRRSVSARFRRLRRKSIFGAPKIIAIIRSPGDEASLALAAAEILGRVSSLLWSLIARPLFKLLSKAPRRGVLWSAVTIPLLALTIALAFGNKTSEINQYIIRLGLGIVTVPFAAALLLVPASAAAAVAIGIEMALGIYVQDVSVGGMPPGWSGRAFEVRVARKEARSALLKHSIHKLKGTRRAVSLVIREDIEKYRAEAVGLRAPDV